LAIAPFDQAAWRGDGGGCYQRRRKGTSAKAPGALKWAERLQLPLTGPLANTCFGFEADFTSDLRCIPMAVRRKLDLAGVKLKLQHWSELEEAERGSLLAWPDDPAAIETLRKHLLERTAGLSAGQAKQLPQPAHEPWQQAAAIPEVLAASCAQLGLAIRNESWAELNELQRFALVKLSHPGHEHRNLPRALAEFGLLAPGPSQ
jgi:hypothetical protein